jgi:hypothetical protein
MNPDLSKSILNSIHTKKLTPRPRWHVQLKRLFLWLAAIGCVGFGSIAIGTTLTIAQQNDWELYRSTGTLSQPLFFLALSYFWILLLVICLGGAYYLFIHTRHGYRYRMTSVVFCTTGCGALLGLGLFVAGVGYAVDTQFEEALPAYGAVLSPRQHIWVQPDEGRLAGKVQRITAPMKFTIVDAHGRLWLVETDNTLEDTVATLETERTVHLSGSKIDNATFHATQIRLYTIHNRTFFFFGAQHGNQSK